MSEPAEGRRRGTCPRCGRRCPVRHTGVFLPGVTPRRCGFHYEAGRAAGRCPGVGWVCVEDGGRSSCERTS